MRIISKQGKGFRDYYDFLQGILGQDELVVYDRRDAFPIDPSKCTMYTNGNIDKWFSKEVTYGDETRHVVKKWNMSKVINLQKHEEEIKELSHSKQWKRDHEEVLEGKIYHFVLEVGYHHYYFEVERYIDDDDENRVHLNYGLVEHKRIEKGDKISSAPMCLAPVSYEKYHWNFGNGGFKITDITKEQCIDNPILYSTYIPKFIDPQEIWNDLYEYISSLRDKEFIDSRTNDQHIESNGFDKKVSFRHRKDKKVSFRHRKGGK